MRIANRWSLAAVRGLGSALLATLAACGAQQPLPVSETSSAERIVSLSPAVTEILFALGLGDRVVGVTSFCDHPPEARDKPQVGGFVNPSVESVLARRPDLVLVSPAAGNRDAALAIRSNGVRLEVVRTETLEDTFAAIESIAGLCSVEASGRRLVDGIRERLSRIRERVGNRPRVPVLFCLQRDPLVAAGVGTLPAELVELAGGVNIVELPRYPRIGLEWVLMRGPEVILQSRMDTAQPDSGERALEFWGRWPEIPAVKHGRVFVFDGTTAFRAGPRVIQAAEFLARVLHPEAFPDGEQAT